MKFEMEYTDAEDAVRKVRDELRKLGLLERFILKTIDYMEAEPLRRLDDTIRKRIHYLEDLRLRSWDEEAIKQYFTMLSPDAISFLSLLKDQEGKVTKTAVKEHFNWANMKVAGVVAGITRIAKSMDRKPLVARTHIRIGEEWDILYKISEEKYLEFVKRLLPEKT